MLKPNDEYGGTGVTLGWETTPIGLDARASNAALADPPRTWVLQERIPVRREMFPSFDAGGASTMRDMLVDFAPYLFRGTHDRIPHAPERHRSGQRHVRRRPGAAFVVQT